MNRQLEVQLKQKIMALANENRLDEAKVVAVKLLKKLPKDIELRWALAQFEARTGEYEKSVQSFCKAAVRVSPFQREALKRALDICYGHDFNQLGLQIVDMLVKLGPLTADNLVKQGGLYNGLFQYQAAKKCFEAALKIEPDNMRYHTLLGEACLYLGLCGESALALQKGHTGNPDNKRSYFLEITCSNYSADLSNEHVFGLHKDYATLLEEKYPADFKPPTRVEGSEKLRVGFISSDFYSHSVSYFFTPVVKYLDRSKVEVFCYSDVAKPDAVTALTKQYSDHWRDCLDVEDERVCDIIRRDNLDVLVDLVGYMGEGRLGVFARRAAPVQVTYLGYPNTTGLSQMDYRLTDEWSDPVSDGGEFYSETLCRISGGFLCYQPYDEAPRVAPLPAIKLGKPVTFCSLNVFQKLTDANFRMWSEILKSVPGSNLIIKSKPLFEKSLQVDVKDRFIAYGLDASRIEILPWTLKRVGHLKLLERVDICLDSYPYAGTTTTCEALWQGIPTVSLAGDNHRSRVGSSILNQVGLGDWVAKTRDEYISIAISKASDLEALSQVRQKARDRMKACTLVNPDLFARNFEDALFSMSK